ncbi:MAG TPA: alanine--tRNA ligase [Lichenihabitans sp.]|jgi:alanyl-tRNA synthetase|nr:alanine--tRNA ligase [Lichenihabitans sp.]
MTSVNEIRSTFLDFFREAGHEVVPSSPLVPRNDPTLMFTSAGMVQFKNLFTGVEKRPYTRATTAQKCLRAGGKHNDLDNVGYTARHHTFFEMLGNFSFGDYFKPQAIELAWRLVTRDFGLNKDRLVVTIYHDDDAAHDLWRKIAGLPESRIIRIATSDNFWAAGDTGPCGPCSEIFYDQGDTMFGGPPGSADEDGDRFLEFWNLVFMQYDQLGPGERVPLPRPSIDTGMGLERISAILQGVTSNYATDLMRTIILAVAGLTGVDPDGPQAASHRIVADHLRASAFLVADGVDPSNEGRGYVLRRIMRRAMRHTQMLGAAEPLMWKLVPTLVGLMGQAYPELVAAQSRIEDVLRSEETRFRTTLARGLAILDEETRTLRAGDRLAGDVAFRLYDTYGFPLDLTQEALRGRSMTVDEDGFAAAMARQKAEARRAWAGSGEAATDAVWFGLRDRVGATEFLGYAAERAETIVTALLRDGAEVEALGSGERGLIVLNQTPFYGESGGQVGDRGTLRAPGLLVRVTDTSKKLGDVFVHEAEVVEGSVRPGMALEAEVDHARRTAIRANHSATHLLHEALRQVLGDHVAQKGSLVDDERLRFDFSHQKPMTPEELVRVEDIANRIVLQNDPVTTRIMAIDDARASGARALFGEKYGDEVRVVAMGRSAQDGGATPEIYSIELCGGTHAARTGDIGLVSILGESAVGSGIRRIEARTGERARHGLNADAARLRDIAGLVRAPPERASERLAALLDERRRLERELNDTRKRLALGGGGAGGQASGATRTVGGVSLMARAVTGIDMRDLKGLADEAKQTIGSGIVAIVGVGADGKAGLVVAVTPDLTARFNSVDLVRAGAAELGGKGGGGRPDMAQAGGPEGGKAAAALEAVARAIESATAAAAE